MLRAIRAPVAAAIERLAGESSRDPEIRRRKLILTFILTMMIGIGAGVIVALAALVGAHPTVWLVVATWATHLVVLVFARRTPDATAPAVALTLTFTFGLLAVALVGGGIGSGAVLWLVVVPFTSVLLLPRRIAATMTALLCAGLVGLFVVDWWGVNPWQIGELSEIVIWIDLISAISAAVAAHLVASYTERVRAKMSALAREREVELHEARRSEALGRMAGGVIHDFNNLMTIVAYHAANIRTDRTHARVSEALDAFDEVVEQSSRLTEQLRSYLSKNRARASVVEIAEFVKGLRGRFRETLAPEVELQIDLPEQGLPVRIERSGFERALLAVARNADDAMSDGGVFTVTVRPAAQGDAEGVSIELSDTGSGMEPEVLERAFEPFFTTKAMTRGTGLELASVRGIVRQYGGTIEAESEPGEGTTFRIWLPLTRADESSESE